MKTLVLVLAMVALVGGSCLAQSTVMASFNVSQSTYSLIALPQVALDPAVGGSQAANKNGDPNGVFGKYNTSANFTLQYWNGGGYETWSDHATTPFTSMTLGTGYWCTGSALPAGGVVSYAALLDGVPELNPSTGAPVTDSAGNNEQTDMYISLPGEQVGTGGWTIIGMPFNHSVAINATGDGNSGSRILFSNGQQTLGWKAAVNAGWVSSGMLRWNGGGYATHGYSGSATKTLTPGYGYWVQTYIDNLAVIIPGMEAGT